MIKLSSLGDTPIAKIYVGDSLIYSKDVPPETKPIPEALYLLNFNGDVVDSAGMANMQWHNEGQKATFVPANQGQALSFKGTATSPLQDTIYNTTERDLGDNNFTIEFFARLPFDSSGGSIPLSYGTARPLMNLSWWITLSRHSGLSYKQSRNGWGGDTQYTGGAIPTSVELSEFVHYAITKDSEGLVRLFVGGVKVGEELLDKTFFRSTTLGLTVGALDYPSYPYNFTGDISGVRLSKGVVRYKEDFLPPTDIMEAKP